MGNFQSCLTGDDNSWGKAKSQYKLALQTSEVLHRLIFGIAGDWSDSTETHLTYCWPEGNAGDAEEQCASGTEGMVTT